MQLDFSKVAGDTDFWEPEHKELSAAFFIVWQKLRQKAEGQTMKNGILIIPGRTKNPCILSKLLIKHTKLKFYQEIKRIAIDILIITPTIQKGLNPSFVPRLPLFLLATIFSANKVLQKPEQLQAVCFQILDRQTS